jgi:hypothetical protein
MCSILAVLPSKAENQEAQLPSRTLGDKWTYSITNPTDELVVTATVEITNTSTIISGYDCIEITGTYGGNISSAGITRTYSGISKSYETTKDHGLVKYEMTVETIKTDSNDTNKLEAKTENSYNPPLNSYDFPLSVGKNWTTTTNQTTTISITSNGVTDPFDKFEETNTTNAHLVVLRTEIIKVPAGEFQTFVINGTSDGGSFENYYSPKAHRMVKQLGYNAEGNLFDSTELLSYHVIEPQEDFPSIYLIIAGIIILAVILVAGALFAVRARPKESSARYFIHMACTLPVFLLRSHSHLVRLVFPC